MKQRATADGPWCWQNKNTLKMILVLFEPLEGIQAGSATAVYTGLTHLASDYGSNRFTTSIANIYRYSGMGRTQTKRILKVLEEFGIVHICRNYDATTSRRDTSTYTINSHEEFCISIHELEVAWRPTPVESEKAVDLPIL